jgi:hypothetical protein
VHAPDRERARDVEDALHQRPDAGEDEQDIGLLDEELTGRPEYPVSSRVTARNP